MIFYKGTSSGKTTLLTRILRNAQEMFTPCPPNLYVIYSEDQTAYDEIKNMSHFKRIEFIKGSKEVLEKYEFERLSNCILIIDDLMSEIVNDKRVKNVFTKLSHHRNITLISLLQNMFPRGNYSKDMRLNLHYCIIMKSFTLEEQINTLGYLAFRKTPKFLPSAYDIQTASDYSYLVIVQHPKQQRLFRVLSDIFPGEYLSVYIPENAETI